MKTAKDQPEKGAIDLCEEATFLLRNAPAAVWVYYFLGTMPFLLGLLYFWSDMTRGQQAGDRLVLGSLALAILFIWMKYWQVLFAARLRNVITDTEPDRVSLRDSLRIAVAQARWQPWGLILLPISAVLAFPLGWVYAYYQNLMAAGAQAASQRGDRDVQSTAISQAKLWPKQNHLILLIVSGLWMIIFVNVAIALVLVPKILITVFGVKEIFEPSFWLILNTTFLALVTVITHLVLDPFIKALYILRCFYGESQTTGEDLRVRMLRAAQTNRSADSPVRAERLTTNLRTRLSALLLVCAAVCVLSTGAAERTEELNTAINEVLQQPEYKWKLPREVVETQDRGPLAEFLAKIGEAINRLLRAMFNGIRAFFDWLGEKFGRNPIQGDP